MKTWQRMVSLLVFAVVVMAATPAMAANLENSVLHFVNVERMAAGVQPLTMDETLVAASDIRAEEAGVHFAHQRPDGREVQSVVADESYSWFGENLAVSTAGDAEEIVQAWMNSPTHRANILNRHYTKMGVTCAKGADGRYYWAQEMACD